MSVLLINGTATHIPLADNSVQCVVTSPPYWKKRDYGLPPSVWGGDPSCEHQWQDASYRPTGHTDDGVNGSGLQGGKATQAQTQRGVITQAWCVKCGAWLGCLGLEPTPEMYVDHMVQIFREVRRVLSGS